MAKYLIVGFRPITPDTPNQSPLPCDCEAAPAGNPDVIAKC